MNKRAKISLGLVAAGALLLTGCSSSPEPQTQASATAHGSTTSTSPKPQSDRDLAANVVIDPRITAMCDIPEPRFEFDSHELSPTATRSLDALAACFTSGPAKDKGLRLVGHADPRGELYYNFGLGQRRAGTVATAITERGLAGDRLTTLSRGELDATGSDEEGWERDRRVQIMMVD